MAKTNPLFYSVTAVTAAVKAEHTNDNRLAFQISTIARQILNILPYYSRTNQILCALYSKPLLFRPDFRISISRR
jgi:hypothetical protein